MGVKIIDLAKRSGEIASVCCVPTDPDIEAEAVDIPESELTSAEIDIDEEDVTEVIDSDTEEIIEDAEAQDESAEESSND